MSVEDDGGSGREKDPRILKANASPSLGPQQMPDFAGTPQMPGTPERGISREQSTAEMEEQQTLDIINHFEPLAEINANDTVFLVAWQLPIRVYKDTTTGKWNVTQSKAALLPWLYELRKKQLVRVICVGWPGVHVTGEGDKKKITELLSQKDCIPVWIPEGPFNEYLDFCHRFLWPVFHNCMLWVSENKQAIFTPRLQTNTTDQPGYAEASDDPAYLDQKFESLSSSQAWSTYTRINRLYADVLVRHSHENDIIWVQDYHLLMVAQHVTRRIRKANVGLFLHTPFPSTEIFKCLPFREELLRGILCCDTIGFQFYDYARHFMLSCKQLLGCEHQFQIGGFVGLEYGGRQIQIRVSHVSIAYDEEMKTLRDPRVAKKVQQIKSTYKDQTIFASVDRCDKLSGLVLKIRAFNQFLEQYPQYRGKVVLIQYTYGSFWEKESLTLGGESPTSPKPGSSHSQGIQQSEMQGKMTMHGLVDMVDVVNKKWADPNDPKAHIVLRFGQVEPVDRLALCKAADCLLDTSIKDGLNLMPFDFYTAHHQDRKGTCIVSEFSGCSRVLIGALCVNPWNMEAVTKAIHATLTMTPEERDLRFNRDFSYVSSQSLLKWAEDYLLDLKRARKKDDMVYVAFGFGANFRYYEMDSGFRRLESEDVIRAYRMSNLRVFFLDNEGTLAPDRRKVPMAVHESIETSLLDSRGTPPSPEVLQVLSRLSRDPRNIVVILSGRSKKVLTDWFQCGGEEDASRENSSMELAEKDDHLVDFTPEALEKASPLGENLGIAAEHGFFYRVPSITGDKWHSLGVDESKAWRPIAYELMYQYVKRTQGSFIENKGSALVWQYRDADMEFGSWQGKELSSALEDLLFGYPVDVTSGKGYVEVKLKGVNKGVAVQLILEQIQKVKGDVDFVLCMGDDRSDEDMFQAVNEEAVFADERQDDTVSTTSADGGGSVSSSANRMTRSGGGFQRGGSGGYPRMARSMGAGLSSLGNQHGSQSNLLSAGGSRNNSQTGLVDLAGGQSQEQKQGPMSRYFTCTIGRKPSQARTFLDDTDQVSELLIHLANTKSKAKKSKSRGGSNLMGSGTRSQGHQFHHSHSGEHSGEDSSRPNSRKNISSPGGSRGQSSPTMSPRERPGSPFI